MKKPFTWLIYFLLRLCASVGFIILAALIIAIVLALIIFIAAIFLVGLLLWLFTGNEAAFFL